MTLKRYQSKKILSRCNFIAKQVDNSKTHGNFNFYFMLRTFSIVILILSLPIILHNIGSESFAMVSILLTLFQFITILDLGLGNFMISRFTPIFRSAKVNKESEFVTKFLPLLPILSILPVAFVFLVDQMSVLKLAFSLGEGSQYQIKVYIFYILSFFNLMLVCMTKMLLVLNRRDKYQITHSMNVVFPQLILFGSSFFSFSWIDLVLLYQLSSTLVYLLGLVGIFQSRNSLHFLASYFESRFKLNSHYLSLVIESSYRFFFLQLIFFVSSQAGVLLVAQFSDFQEVTEYSIMMRILSVHIGFVSFIFGGSQSEINQILKTSGLKPLKKFFFSVYVFSTVFILWIFTILLLFRENVFFLKLVGGTVFSTELLLSSLLYVVVWSINFPFAVVAISDFPSDWYFRAALASLPVNLIIAVGLLKFVNFQGGPLIANCCTIVVFSIIPFTFWVGKNIRQSDSLQKS